MCVEEGKIMQSRRNYCQESVCDDTLNNTRSVIYLKFALWINYNNYFLNFLKNIVFYMLKLLFIYLNAPRYFDIYFNMWYKLYMYVNSCKLHTADCLLPLSPLYFLHVFYILCTWLCLFCGQNFLVPLKPLKSFCFKSRLNQPRHLMKCWGTWDFPKQKTRLVISWHHWLCLTKRRNRLRKQQLGKRRMHCGKKVLWN